METKELEQFLKWKKQEERKKKPKRILKKLEDNPKFYVVQRKDGKPNLVRKNRDSFFFPDQWMKFFDALTSKQKITFNVLINTGARINEARHIEVRSIDLIRGNIILEKTKVRSKKGEVYSKPRPIPISSKFKRYLKELITKQKLKSEDCIPVLSTPAANIAMKKALQKAKIPDWQMFSVHNVRKTIETWLVALGNDYGKVADHMGHTVLVAQKHYVSPDIFTWDDKNKMREIIGDLYEGGRR